ncbi:hypothetical protein [Halomicrobium katesii]|uniref:hypothetical protein n=1 Tax=Halomicrobium katesii TaxID=437163 RepID=UPI000367A239|nr:hypothetical protein [Halomicrobium katesii]
MGVGGDIASNTLAAIIGLIGGPVAGLLGAVGIDIAMRKWRLLDGDITNRMAKLQEELLEEVLEDMDTGEDSEKVDF